VLTVLNLDLSPMLLATIEAISLASLFRPSLRGSIHVAVYPRYNQDIAALCDFDRLYLSPDGFVNCRLDIAERISSGGRRSSLCWRHRCVSYQQQRGKQAIRQDMFGH
jgi:hypothetical protein